MCNPLLNRIVQTLLRCAKIPEDISPEILLESPLTGCILQLSLEDLVYFFFELESEFNITISSEELENYGFSSIKSIYDIIKVKI